LKGGDNMTVGTQMQQAIAGIQSAAATMKTFALETDDTQAKNEFQQIAQQLDCSLETLKGRQKYIQEQEPQYK
jgi:FtsZ-binding cell division protein ZapB